MPREQVVRLTLEMLWGIKSFAGANCTTLFVVGIDDPKLFRVMLLTDVPFVRTVDGIVKTLVRFVVTLVMVKSSKKMILI